MFSIPNILGENSIITMAVVIYVFLIIRYLIDLNRKSEKLMPQTAFFELVIIVFIIGMIGWTIKQTSKKNQLESADKYLAAGNFSKSLEILISVKQWEKAAELIVKSPKGTQIVFIRRLQSYIPQSLLKNIFLKIGDSYRNTSQSHYSAIAYELADMPWRAAQSYINVGNVEAAIELINVSQVFSNDRNRAVRNLAKYAYDTNHPLEAARLLQSIGANDEATAVLVASGKNFSANTKEIDSVTHARRIGKPGDKESSSLIKETDRPKPASPFLMLKQEIALAQKKIREGSINDAETILNKSSQIIDKIQTSDSEESLELKKEYKKTFEAIKRLLDARKSFKRKRVEESQILYTELLEIAGDLFNSEIYAEAGLAYELEPKDLELVRDYFIEASKRAKTEQAKRNYKARADSALESLEEDIPEAESTSISQNKNIAKIMNVETNESCCVCKRPIGSAQVIQCNQCKSMGHFPHVAEWLKIKGICPVCKQKLKLPDTKTAVMA